MGPADAAYNHSPVHILRFNGIDIIFIECWNGVHKILMENDSAHTRSQNFIAGRELIMSMN